jgi:hypothetical protein
MFYLSGAINVLLFLIIRPGVLLFSRPKELPVATPDIELAPQDTGPAIIPDTERFQRSPEPTFAVEDGGSSHRDIAPPSRDSSRRISNVSI